MAAPQNSNQPVSATSRAPKTWDFMETAFVALIAYAVFTLTAGYGATIILLITQGGPQQLTPAQFQELAMQWRWQGVGLIIACPSTIAVVWVAVRIAGRDIAEYLALNWPSRKELLIAFAVAAAWIAAQI